MLLGLPVHRTVPVEQPDYDRYDIHRGEHYEPQTLTEGLNQGYA